MKAHFTRFARAVVCATILLFYGSPARAAVLLPGGSVTPDVLADPAGTLVDSVSSPLLGSVNIGTITAAVVRLAGTGTLDFYYQITNTAAASSGHNIARNTNISFLETAATEVFYRLENGGLGLFSSGSAGATPLTADRDDDGLAVGFQFTALGVPPASRIGPGETSRILVIRTQATEYVAGSSFVINGLIAGAQTFAPAAAVSIVPEPASLLLLSSAFGAAGYMARHRARRKKPGGA